MPRIKKKSKPSAGEGQSSEPVPSQYPISIFAELLPRNRHPNLVFEPHHYRYLENNENLHKIHKKEIMYPRVIEWNPLEQVGFADKVRRVFTQSMRHEGEVYDIPDFLRLIEIQEPIYRELVLEFLATLEMYEVTDVDQRFLTFKLGGVARHLTLRRLAAYLGIYSNEEFTADWFPRYLMSGARLDQGDCSAAMWERFSSSKFHGGTNLASSIKCPKYNVVQKMISHTLTVRGSNREKVTLIELWFLSKLRDRERINLPYAVAKFLLFYAAGPKPQSKIGGGHLITRIAKGFKINLNPRDNPYTLVENPRLRVGKEMYTTAGILRITAGRYVPYKPSELEASRAPKVKGKRPATQQDSEGEEEDDEEEEEEEQVQSHQGESSSTPIPSYWEGFLSSFQNMQLEQGRRWQQQQTWHREQEDQRAIDSAFRDEARYEWGVNRYQNDWLIHNHERLAHRVPDYEPTPYHHPPQWGEPGGILPAPVYDRADSLVELQRHQEHLRASEYQQQQQDWGTSWSTPATLPTPSTWSVPEPSNWQQEAHHHWLFGSPSPHQQEQQDPTQDPPPSGSWF